MTTKRSTHPGHDRAAATRHRPLTTRSVRAFHLGSFALSWSIGALLVTFPTRWRRCSAPMGYTNPVFILLVYSPGFIGMFMVWRHYGRAGLAGLCRRLTLWRMPDRWWTLLLIGMPAVFYAGAVINGDVLDFPFDPWYCVLPALIPAFLIGPIEELGWRGVALPLLQRRFNGDTMLTRGDGATAVLMPSEEQSPNAAVLPFASAAAHRSAPGRGAAAAAHSERRR